MRIVSGFQGDTIDTSNMKNCSFGSVLLELIGPHASVVRLLCKLMIVRPNTIDCKRSIGFHNKVMMVYLKSYSNTR